MFVLNFDKVPTSVFSSFNNVELSLGSRVKGETDSASKRRRCPISGGFKQAVIHLQSTLYFPARVRSSNSFPKLPGENKALHCGHCGFGCLTLVRFPPCSLRFSHTALPSSSLHMPTFSPGLLLRLILCFYLFLAPNMPLRFSCHLA